MKKLKAREELCEVVVDKSQPEKAGGFEDLDELKAMPIQSWRDPELRCTEEPEELTERRPGNRE